MIRASRISSFFGALMKRDKVSAEAMVPVAVSALENPNSHLKSYIEYYQTLEAPRFAVLVTGEWGTGKTHLVKALLPWEGENAKACYVSLFGMKSSEEIVAAVYSEMHPELAKTEKKIEGAGEAIRGVSVFGFALGGVGSFLASVAAAKMRKDVDQSKIIIFDDLERSDVNEKVLLGTINNYVEHYKCKVIVIAHEDYLIQGIKDSKEKIFGQTIRITPDLQSAFDSFLSEINSPDSRQFVADSSTSIIAVFKASDVKSLRILRQAMFDIVRLYEALFVKYRQNTQAMHEIIELFFALNLEVREGRIDREAFTSFRRMISHQKGADGQYIKTKIGIAQDRYNFIKLDSYLLNDEVLTQMLLMGRFESSAICTSLDDSPHYAKLETLPPWRRVIEFDSLEDDKVDEAIKAMNQQFDDRSVTESGEMLHIFALRFMLAKRGVEAKTEQQVEADCKAYVDDLLLSGQLPPPTEPSQFERSRWLDSAHNHSFWNSEYKDSFQRVGMHLRDQSIQSLEKTYPEAAADLMKLMSADIRKFASAISYSGEGDHKFARLPVLRFVQAEVFVEAWLKAPKENDGWYWIRTALEKRYEGLALVDDPSIQSGWLKSEIPWLKAALTEINKRAVAATGIAKYRIERAIPKITFPEKNKEIQ
jgi:KAP family P-loop domain